MQQPFILVWYDNWDWWYVMINNFIWCDIHYILNWLMLCTFNDVDSRITFTSFLSWWWNKLVKLFKTHSLILARITILVASMNDEIDVSSSLITKGNERWLDLLLSRLETKLKTVQFSKLWHSQFSFATDFIQLFITSFILSSKEKNIFVVHVLE